MTTVLSDGVDQLAMGTLANLFNARSVALIGATERSIWTTSTLDNLARFGFSGALYPVNRKGEAIRGRWSAISAEAVGEPIDAALLMVPASALADAIDDLGLAGIRQAVVLTSGLGEAGEFGASLQAEIAVRAKKQGIRLLGPNCLGFVNYGEALPLWTVPIHRSRRPGRLAILSQSGAMADEMQRFAHRQGIGIAFLASTGNEADIEISEIIDFLVDDPGIDSIALFLEMVRSPVAFRRAVGRARQAGKPVTVLKVGTSEASSRMAQSHTGALVGDDRVFTALCKSEGLIRVNVLEDLVLTADLMVRMPVLGAGGLALGALSGGICEIAADRADRLGLEIPELGSKTVSALELLLPNYAKPQNPLDVTGGAMLRPELLEGALATLSSDPAIAATAFMIDAPVRNDNGGFRSAALAAISAGLATTGKPSLIVSSTTGPLSDYGITFVEALGLTYFSGGVDRAIIALANVFCWHQTQRFTPAAPASPAVGPTSLKPQGEREVLGYLATCGVRVISATVTRSAAESAAAASEIGGPVALKILARDLAHKSDVGGVLLNITADEAADAHGRLIRRTMTAAPRLKIEGVIVSPMRANGIELVVGLTRDPHWGLVLTLGFGGILVEVLNDVCSRLLPIDTSVVIEMLAELNGSRLLDGYRGVPAADRRSIAKTVCKIVNAAEALGPDLLSLEVNPLLVVGNTVECLDGFSEWNSPGGKNE